MIDKTYLKNEYLVKGRSMQMIADSLGCSLNKVQYWLKSHNIKIRNRSEANYKRNNPKGDPFSIVLKKNPGSRYLLGMGLGLWWGEGYKKNRYAVRLGNTDPELIRMFIKFLKEVCGVLPEKIRFGLQIFNDVDEKEALNYWINKLKVTKRSFFPKVVVSKSVNKGSYKNKAKYGVCTVYVSNVKLKSALDNLLEQYEQFFRIC